MQAILLDFTRAWRASAQIDGFRPRYFTYRMKLPAAPFSTPPTRRRAAACVASALYFIMLCQTGMPIAQAQTFSETLWTAEQSKPTRTRSNTALPTLPYCTDVRTDKPAPQPQPSRKNNDDSTYAVADKTIASAGQDLLLQGHACVERDTVQMQADSIRYDYASEQVTAEGSNIPATVIKPDGGAVSGKQLQYNLSTDTGRVSPATMDIHAVDNAIGHATAESLSLLSARRAFLAQARYTTCQRDDPDWYLKTDSLLIDQDLDQGTARNATLVFKGVPILATPYARIPLGNRRQSGFLTPTAGYSTLNGTRLVLPYYFNLAPNYDATLSPEWLTSRGFRLGGEYRYLSQWGNGIWNADWLPHDSQTNTDRYYWHITHDTAGTFSDDSRWKIHINSQRVSDQSFIDDFNENSWNIDTRVMPSEYSLSWQKNDLSLRLREKTYQTLQNSDNTIQVPYNLEPQFNLNYHKRVGQWLFSLPLEATRFTHPDSTNYAQGSRYLAYPSVAYEWRTPGIFFIPKFGVHLTQYDLSTLPTNNSANYDMHAHRILPITTIDSGLILERNDQWFGKNIVQTLEPRVYYANIPYRNQTRIWNFDSALADLDFSRIYTENLFTGSDRIAQANQLTTGITSRILSQENGEEFFQFALAQRYYFGKQNVTLANGDTDTDVDQNTHRKSDLLGAVSGRISAHTWAQAFAQYNSEQGRLLRYDFALHWQPAYRRVVNFGVHQNRILTEPTKTLYASAQMPLRFVSQNLYGVARLNYDLNAKHTTDVYAGFEYAKNCWIFRFVGQHSITNSGRTNNSISFQLELRGLGNLGQHTDKALKTQIEGYHPTDFDEVAN